MIDITNEPDIACIVAISKCLGHDWTGSGHPGFVCGRFGAGPFATLPVSEYTKRLHIILRASGIPVKPTLQEQCLLIFERWRDANGL